MLRPKLIQITKTCYFSTDILILVFIRYSVVTQRLYQEPILTFQLVHHRFYPYPFEEYQAIKSNVMTADLF